MKVEVVATGKILDVPRTPLLQVLAEAGVLKFLPEPAPAAPQLGPPKTTWKLLRSEDKQGELFVRVHCETCWQGWSIRNPTDKYVFAHCGVRESVPADTLRKGKKEWEADATTRTFFKHFQAEVAASEKGKFTL